MNRTLIVFAIAALASTAHAQDSALVERTRFGDAFETEDWPAAERAFERLVAVEPGAARDLAYRRAVVLAHRQKPREAALVLERLLADEPDHVLALGLLARLETDPARAGQLLLRAASHGYDALGDVCVAKRPEFARLRTNPGWILQALRARGDAVAVVERDPFRPPVRANVVVVSREVVVSRVVVVPRVDLQRRDALVRAVEEALAQVAARVQAADLDGLHEALARVRGLFRECEAAEDDLLARKLVGWRHRLEDDGVRALVHQAELEAATALVQAMRASRDAERIEDGLARFEELRARAERMRRKGGDLAASAAPLLLAGQAIRDELERMRTVRDLAIEVRGVVCDPRTRSRTILVTRADPRGWIYEEGDALREGNGDRVRGLRIVRIGEGFVTFRFEGLEFTRRLSPPGESRRN